MRASADPDSFSRKMLPQKVLEQFQISVIEHRGRYSYLHPDRQKRITERALGTRYGKAHLEQTFLREDPLAILYARSHLRLVVNLQINVKAMQTQFAQHRSDLRSLNEQIRYTGQYYANNSTSLTFLYPLSFEI